MSELHISFHDDFSELSNKYIVFELNDEVIKELESGTVNIVGKEGDEAVLCTKKSTFRIRKAETSNCSLLVPLEVDENTAPNMSTVDHENNHHIISSISSYFELQKINPKISVLREYLTEFTGEYESSSLGKTTNELIQLVQASEVELRIALKNMKAFKLRNRWRILSDNYERELFSLILFIIQSNMIMDDEESIFDKQFDLETIYTSVVSESASSVEKEIIKHLLRCYSSKVRKPENQNSPNEFYIFDQQKILIFYALDLIKTANNQTMDVDMFIEKWNARCPSNLRPDRNLLKGLILESEIKGKNYFIYYPASALPADLPSRFSELFTYKPKWTFNEIVPYLRFALFHSSFFILTPLIYSLIPFSSCNRDVAQNATVEQLLFKHCRSIVVNGEKFYSKR